MLLLLKIEKRGLNFDAWSKVALIGEVAYAIEPSPLDIDECYRFIRAARVMAESHLPFLRTLYPLD